MDGYYIGLMTGSSADAIDAVIVRLANGLPILIQHSSTPYRRSLRDAVIRITHGDTVTTADICALDAKIGRELALAAEALIKKSGLARSDILAIGSHGQTVCHLPDHAPPGTLQLGDAAQIAEFTGVATVTDFRHRDMAAGGQGAPLAPILHAACLRSKTEDRCVLNLGGIANITVLPADASLPVTGFDTGPANALLDLWIQKHTEARFDRNGAWASGGNVIEPLLQRWLQDPYFARTPPKSTGRDYFNEQWLQALFVQNFTPQDVQTTLAELTAHTVSDAIGQFAPSTQAVLACGGGAHNADLLARISRLLDNTRVESTATHGIDPEWVEAMLIAWLAACSINGVAGNVPGVTGAKGERICGAIYPA